jgi:PAS domain S-box-containing protein
MIGSRTQLTFGRRMRWFSDRKVCVVSGGRPDACSGLLDSVALKQRPMFFSAEFRRTVGLLVAPVERVDEARGGACATNWKPLSSTPVSRSPGNLHMTERADIKHALKECERKFLNAFRESPLALTLTSAIDHRYIEVNDTFERISGWSREEVIGRTPFDIEIWVDPSERIAFVRRLLAGDTVRNLEVHARLKHHELWTGSGSAALIEIHGETCVLSLIAGIADLKRAEEAKQVAERLSHMARRLIQSHEEEHAAIAQELRDHVERLALLAAELDRVRHNPPESVAALSQTIDEARQQVMDLVMDIQALSRRLHSSELELLGLAAAAAGFCRELSDHKNIEIDFASEGVPDELSHEVSLCVFRVLQEALQTAVSHSGSRRFQVSLTGEANELHLAVRDVGIGFDPEDAQKGPGLSLAIMSERLKLVDGTLWIESQREGGTTIRARVPLDGRTDSG